MNTSPLSTFSRTEKPLPVIPARWKITKSWTTGEWKQQNGGYTTSGESALSDHVIKLFNHWNVCLLVHYRILDNPHPHNGLFHVNLFMLFRLTGGLSDFDGSWTSSNTCSLNAQVVEDCELLVIELWYNINILLALFALFGKSTLLVHSDLKSDEDRDNLDCEGVIPKMASSPKNCISRMKHPKTALNIHTQSFLKLRVATIRFTAWRVRRTCKTFPCQVYPIYGEISAVSHGGWITYATSGS